MTVLKTTQNQEFVPIVKEDLNDSGIEFQMIQSWTSASRSNVPSANGATMDKLHDLLDREEARLAMYAKNLEEPKANLTPEDLLKQEGVVNGILLAIQELE